MKAKDLQDGEAASAFSRYRRLMYGDMPLARMLWAELITTLFSWVPGALGLFLRRLTYPSILGATGRGLTVGRDVTLRHPHKIRLGRDVVLDDGCLVDAKGQTNRGIVLGDRVYVGRHTLVYCKNGDIEIGDRVNLGANGQVFSSHRIVMQPDTMVGAYSYFLSGGTYDPGDPTPYSRQEGNRTKGALQIGRDCWIGARVTVLDAASIGDRCVIGAGAVVTRPLPSSVLAVGVPARVVKTWPREEGAASPEPDSVG